MFVILLAITLSGKQFVYAPMGQTLEFASYEQCSERAKTEMERLRHVIQGEFLLSCLPHELVHD